MTTTVEATTSKIRSYEDAHDGFTQAAEKGFRSIQQIFELGLYSGVVDWDRGERYYDSEYEQAVEYGYSALEAAGFDFLFVEGDE